MRISAGVEQFALDTPLRIAGHTWRAFTPVVVRISDGAFEGRGEGVAARYRPQSPADFVGLIEQLDPDQIALGGRMAVNDLMPANGARNAIDCALWDLEAKQTGVPVWALADLPEPRPVPTLCGIGICDLEETSARVRALAERFLRIKLKLGSPDGLDLERVRVARDAAPAVRLFVDVNGGWTFEILEALAPHLCDLGVEFIEQPLPAGADAALEDFQSKVPLCADESFQSLLDAPAVCRRYDIVNIKLDKAGGLTEGLRTTRTLRALGLKTMVGNMLGTSLSMASAFHLALECDYADLDGPTPLARDRTPPTLYDQGCMLPPPVALWG